MKDKLRIDITPIAGNWGRGEEILQKCKEAIEKWSEKESGGYVVRKYHREEGGVLLGTKTVAPFLILESIDHEECPQVTCEECDGSGQIDDPIIKEKNDMEKNKIMCCFISRSGENCEKEAEFEVIFGNAPSDITESCSNHIGELGDNDSGRFETIRLNKGEE